MSRFAAILVSLLFADAAAVCVASEVAVRPDPLRPPTTGGLEAIDRNLAKLETHARVLVIGAHPDDEDTALLALVARGMHGEAAYLSLSRGEGGQNLIGSELGVPLGLLRTQELLAARRLDGGRQYFTRAYDFGYTASLAETMARWPKEILLEDTVRVIRRFRPQVVVSVFPNDGGGGHGQHQAAGVVAHEAFARAGDRTASPALSAEGLAPWAPEALYRSTWFDRAQTTLVLSTGVMERFSGRSIYQLAMASRSQHRSQDMGRLQEVGPKESRLGWVSGGAGPTGAQLFAGIDTRLRSIALQLPAGPARDALWANLTRVEESARSARAKLGQSEGDGALLAAGARETLLRLRGAVSKVTDPTVLALLEEKVEAATAAWLGARGVVLDATVDRETVAPGETVAVVVSLWNAGRDPIHVTGLGLLSRAGWQGTETAPPFAAQDLPPGRMLQWTVTATAPASGTGFDGSTPYFLRRPLRGDLYDWSDVPAETLGLAFEDAPLVARLALEEDGQPVAAERAVSYRRNDQAAGEIRRPLRAAPRLEVSVEPALLVATTAAPERPVSPVEVRLVSHSLRPLRGRIEWTAPAGWPVPEPSAFSLEARGSHLIAVPWAPPAPLPPGRFSLRARAVIEDDGARSEIRDSLPLVDHPHVPPTPFARPAEVVVVATDLRLPTNRRVAYVPGSGDRMPDALRSAGFVFAVLDGEALLRRGAADLVAAFDTIVIGSRAYETEPALREANPRLREFVESGGVLVVLYQQYPFVEGGFAPLALTIARPHDRTTDETAPVTVLAPEHPVFRAPNGIGPADWEGWVQERGLYYAREWDAAYRPLLELPTSGEPSGAPSRGSLLVARVGRGAYVYSGLAFFRQLPAGVAGAYRLFANLMALDPAGL